jgi:arginine deiminase
MHLDTVFTMVDYENNTIHPEIEGPLNVFEITKGGGGDSIVAVRERWNDGSNTLAIAPGNVITYKKITTILGGIYYV